MDLEGAYGEVDIAPALPLPQPRHCWLLIRWQPTSSRVVASRKGAREARGFAPRSPKVESATYH